MTRVLAILFVLVAGCVGAAEKYVGQVRVMNRPEGAVLAIDEGGDGLVDRLWIAGPIGIAVAFAGPATIESGESFVAVVPVDGTVPCIAYVVKRADHSEHGAWSTRRPYRSAPVNSIVQYEGRVVAYPLAELATLPIPRVPGEKLPRSVKLSAIPSFGDDHGLYVGRVRILPRAGHVVIAVDDSKSHDGTVDALLVVETTKTVEPWNGNALVEVTDAGLRVVDLDQGMRLVLALQPSVIQARSGAVVAVPIADVDTLDVETPSALRQRLLSEHADDFPELPGAARDAITNCPGGAITEPCYPDPPPSPGGGGGTGVRKCSQPCVYGRCSVECYAGQTPWCRCSNTGQPLCTCL